MTSGLDNALIEKIVAELRPALCGRRVGKVFQLSKTDLAIDFRLRASNYLFISVNPREPRLYLISRKVKELESVSITETSFVLLLRKYLHGALLRAIQKTPHDRIVRFVFEATSTDGTLQKRSLVVHLTGRSANAFLLYQRDVILATARDTNVEDFQAGSTYRESVSPAPRPEKGLEIELKKGKTISEALDAYDTEIEEGRKFDQEVTALRKRLRSSSAQKKRLLAQLNEELAATATADHERKLGELLLANLSTAKRKDRTVAITDFYQDDAPTIEIDIEPNVSLQEEAARRFARYSKAKRGAEQIANRIQIVEKELIEIDRQQKILDVIARKGNVDELSAFKQGSVSGRVKALPRGRKEPARIAGARRYESSDGYEIYVGRGAKDNDHLTFRVARPNDLWLHAADYPGSHVIVRNPSRREIPHRTIIEAAQLAANFSDARDDSKVNVHYTQRKFVSKPKGAAPGLVRMSSFRTIAVEPNSLSAQRRM